MEAEFSRVYDRRNLPARPVVLEANEAERTALARRFGLVAIHGLRAEITLDAAGESINANGLLEAEVVQSCAVSGDDLAVTIAEPLALVFVPAAPAPTAEEEIELEEHELDEIAYEGTAFDLGEAVAQSLALAIDPFATGPNAEAARRDAGLADEDRSGPLAAGLAALKGLTRE